MQKNGSVSGVIEKILIALMVALPFSPFLVTLIGTRTGSVVGLTLWKEVLIALVFFLALFLAIKSKINLKKPIVVLVFVYLIFMILHVLVDGDFSRETGAGLLVNGRFLVAFLAAYFLANSGTVDIKRISKILVVVSVIVSIVAIALLLLPSGVLESVGYDKTGVDEVGVPASEYFVSSDVLIRRAQSTLRGPNSLGLYLLLPLALLLFDVAPFRGRKQVAFSASFMSVILLTFSRAAVLGLIIIIGFYFAQKVKNGELSKRTATIMAVSLATLGLAASVAIIKTPSLNDFLLHETEGQANGSSSVRLSEYRQSLDEIMENPWGEGVGSASVATRVSQSGVSRTTENYFLQIGRELGILGLALFVALVILVVQQILKMKEHKTMLLGVFSALLICCLFLPVWGEEAISITFWVFAGYIIFTNNPIKKVNKKRTNTKK